MYSMYMSSFVIHEHNICTVHYPETIIAKIQGKKSFTLDGDGTCNPMLAIQLSVQLARLSSVTERIIYTHNDTNILA